MPPFVDFSSDADGVALARLEAAADDAGVAFAVASGEAVALGIAVAEVATLALGEAATLADGDADMPGEAVVFVWPETPVCALDAPDVVVEAAPTPTLTPTPGDTP